MASDDDDMAGSSPFLNLDRKYLKPFFTRLRPRTRVDEAPDSLDMDEFELLESNYPTRGKVLTSSSSSNAVEMTSMSTSSTDSEDPPTAVFAESTTSNSE